MDLTLSEEQRMLQDAAARFVRERYGLEERRRLLAAPDGWRGHWHSYAQFGWLGLLVPERFGGLGWTVLDAALLFEELGHAIVLEPLLAATLCVCLIDLAGNEAACAARLPGLAGGETILALACEESHERRAAGS